VTPEQIEQVRPRLVEFTARMLDGAVARSDQQVIPEGVGLCQPLRLDLL
jgi:hypothetical protein